MCIASLKGDGYDVIDELEASLLTVRAQRDWGSALGDMRYAILRRAPLKGQAWSWRGNLHGFTLGEYDCLIRDNGVNKDPRFTLVAVRSSQERSKLEQLARTRLERN